MLHKMKPSKQAWTYRSNKIIINLKIKVSSLMSNFSLNDLMRQRKIENEKLYKKIFFIISCLKLFRKSTKSEHQHDSMNISCNCTKSDILSEDCTGKYILTRSDITDENLTLFPKSFPLYQLMMGPPQFNIPLSSTQKGHSFSAP